MARGTEQHRWLGIALALTLLAASLGAMGAVTMVPGDDEAAPVAVVFPVWWGTDRSLSATLEAGGVVVREGGLSSLLVAQSSEPGFRRKLRAAGAWLLLDPKAIAACLR